MTHDNRLPYADAETPREMAVDAHEVGANLHLERPMVTYPTEFLGERAPSPSERLHSRYEVSDDLARLADGMELHFD